MLDKRPNGMQILRQLLLHLLAVLICVLCFGPAESAIAAAANPATPSQSQIGVEMRIDNIYGLSLREKTYNIDGTVWFYVPPLVQAELLKFGGAVSDFIDFYNVIQPWNSELKSVTAGAAPLADGVTLQGYEFNAIFYSDNINFRSYPFGDISLEVVLQPRSTAATGILGDIQLRAIPGGAELGSRVGLNGYDRAGLSFGNVAYKRQSHLGKGRAEVNSRVQLKVSYRVERFSVFVRWLLPLLIVMLLMLLTPNLSTAYGTERLSVPPTVMLTLVFMQQSYRESLPNLPYVTFLDSLYCFSYLVTLAFFLLFVWSMNRMTVAVDSKRQALMHRIDRFDLLLQLASMAGFAAITLFALWRF
jgi:hypothetical protein